MAPETSNPLVLAGRNDLFGDLLNDELVVKPTKVIGESLLTVDRASSTARPTDRLRWPRACRSWSAGCKPATARSYALTMVMGVILVGAVLILGQLG